VSAGAFVCLSRSDDFSRAVRDVVPEGVTAVYDTALLNRAAFGAIRDGGGLVVVRGWDGSEPARDIRIVAVMVATALQRTDWLEHLRALASDGRVAGTYAPEQAAEAHRAMAAGGLRGRALIVF
jgi:NADPH:quinone reductase